MKRGKKPFTIHCGGTFDTNLGTFGKISSADFKRLRGMSQEIMHPNKWMSNVATCFRDHRKHDARKQLCRLINLFDPANMLNPKSVKSFRKYLIDYDNYLVASKDAIRALYNELSQFYDSQDQGESVAKQMITLAWECGQISRFNVPRQFKASTRDERQCSQCWSK